MKTDIITISNLDKNQFFFTTDHCQPHNLGSSWVSCTSTLPMVVTPRKSLPTGIITNKAEYKKVMCNGFGGEPMEDIPNPQPEYQA